MSLVLHDYQNAIIEETRNHLRAGLRSVLIQSPTGSGKTVLTAHMAGSAADRGMRTWFNVHRRELVKQSVRTFSLVGIAHGVIAAGFLADPRQLVQIGSIQTLARRLHRLARPRFIIHDEAHHMAAGMWRAIYEAFPDAIHVGLSATPERLDGAGLAPYFGAMVRGPTVAELIARGYLAPYRLFAPQAPDLSGVHTKLGDFVRGEVSHAMDDRRIMGNAIEHYLRLARGKRAVVFACSIDHSRHIVAEFTAAGVRAAHIDGETDHGVRDATIQAFERGELEVLSNVELFGEGFDLPALEVAILLRPTQSLTLYLQQVGRALRPSPGKTEALILDHAGNALRHGLPDDDREWTLEGRKKLKGASSDLVPIKMCPRCFLAGPSASPKCRYCNYVFPIVGREVEEVAGELVEVDPKVVRRQRMREQAKASSLDDLIALGTSRGYRNPRAWAEHILRARGTRAA
jgi:DNA repair protein RadD